MDEAAIRQAVEEANAANTYIDAVQLLLEAGVRIYYTDIRFHTTYYSSDLATHVDWLMPSFALSEPPPAYFDRPAIHAATLALQRLETDYEGFLRRSWGAGVVEFEVNLLWRQITYRGVHGESHVESITQLTSPPERVSVA